MQLAWFTPLPPMLSGIADYSSEIVPHVARRAGVTLFCPRPGLFRRPQVPVGLSVRHPSDYFDDGGDRDGRFDATYYHLANNPHHEFVYRAARRRPEIAVFHDVVLHHLIAAVTIEGRRRDPSGYEAALYGEYGHLGTRLAMLRRVGLASDFEKFLFPLTAHVAGQAKGIVVHSHDAAEKMAEIAPDVPIAVIPHHAGTTPAEVEGITREEARDRLGLPQDAFVVGHFGFVTRPKQPAAVVGGFKMLHDAVPHALLLVVGEDHTGGALNRLVERLGLRGAVRREGYVGLERFYLYLKASDAQVNLRYPSAGESSGTFARGLAEGRAAIVNNYASFAEVPGDVALKVEIDGPQAQQVGVHLLRLARDPAFRSTIEANAQRYARTVLDPGRCSDLYVEFAERVGSGGDVVHTAIPRGEPRSAVALAETKRHHGRLRTSLDAVLGETLPEIGNGAYVDALYRMVLRRPAEDDAIRAAHAELAGGEQLTRAGLLERIVASREFAEVKLLDELVRDLRRDPRPFTLPVDSPLGPGTTERLIEIPWMLSRWRGERRVLDVGYAYASLSWLSGLMGLRIESLHGIDMAALAVPQMRRTQADVRRMPYADGSFDLVYCISTIEHIGRDNTAYGLSPAPADHRAGPTALSEMGRVLRPFGRVLISVPLGRREDHGWFLQYDSEAWTALVRRSPFEIEEQEQFRLTRDGWIRVDDPRTMGLLSYADDAPAARGVLCAVLVKRA